MYSMSSVLLGAAGSRDMVDKVFFSSCKVDVTVSASCGSRIVLIILAEPSASLMHFQPGNVFQIRNGHLSAAL